MGELAQEESLLRCLCQESPQSLKIRCVRSPSLPSSPAVMTLYQQVGAVKPFLRKIFFQPSYSSALSQDPSGALKSSRQLDLRPPVGFILVFHVSGSCGNITFAKESICHRVFEQGKGCWTMSMLLTCALITSSASSSAKNSQYPTRSFPCSFRALATNSSIVRPFRKFAGHQHSAKNA